MKVSLNSKQQQYDLKSEVKLMLALIKDKYREEVIYNDKTNDKNRK